MGHATCCEKGAARLSRLDDRPMGRGQGQAANAVAVRTRAIRPSSAGTTSAPVNEDLVLLELAAFLTGMERWPARQEFIDAGQAQLYRQAEQTGGAERWAAEFGLTHLPEPQDPEEESLRAELASFLAGFDHWPTFGEFRIAGRTTLYGKVLRHGGSERWAQDFGLSTVRQLRETEIERRREQGVARRRGRARHRRWTVDLVRAELAAFLAQTDHFPSEKEFVAAGESSLYRALSQFGGAEHWAIEFGLPRASDLSRQRAEDLRAFQAATAEARGLQREQRIRELEAFCAGRDYFPAHSEWAAAGRKDLQEFVHRNGGVQAWSKRLGLPLRPAQDRRPYDLERALADGRQMIAKYGYIPGADRLRGEGLNKLYLFIRREFNGDRAAFADLCR